MKQLSQDSAHKMREGAERPLVLTGLAGLAGLTLENSSNLFPRLDEGGMPPLNARDP
jgi:hypothetical protein